MGLRRKSFSGVISKNIDLKKSVSYIIDLVHEKIFYRKYFSVNQHHRHRVHANSLYWYMYSNNQYVVSKVECDTHFTPLTNRMVPIKSTGSCGMMDSLDRRSCRPRVEISMPSNLIVPESSSTNRNKATPKEDFPGKETGCSKNRKSSLQQKIYKDNKVTWMD